MEVKSKVRFLIEAKLLLRQIWQSALVIGCVCLFAFLTARWIEALVFCISHVEIRRRFDKQYHTTQLYCLSISIGVALFGITTPLPIGTSVLATIPLALSVCYVGYAFQDRIDLRREYLLPFNCKRAAPREIFDRARRKQLSDEQAGWIVDKFVQGMTYKQLCRPEESEKSCQVRIKRIVDKLNAPM